MAIQVNHYKKTTPFETFEKMQSQKADIYFLKLKPPKTKKKAVKNFAWVYFRVKTNKTNFGDTNFCGFAKKYLGKSARISLINPVKVHFLYENKHKDNEAGIDEK